MKRKRELTHEDREVWYTVTRGVRPYHAAPLERFADKCGRISATEARHNNNPEPRSDTIRTRNALAQPVRRKTGVDHNSEPPAPARPHAATAGDPGLDRRAARGRLPIDATLDLHGHYQASAHAALRAFINSASMRGYRCVLVITGKGATSSGAGILRRRFLEWIEERDLREHIVRIARAHQRHGGAGAFYVFLKSRQGRGVSR